MDDKGKALLREERKQLLLIKDRLLAEITQFRDEISDNGQEQLAFPCVHSLRFFEVVIYAD